MATPNAAKHHDLEQRLRNLETAVKGLGSVALGRKLSPIYAVSRQEDNGSTTIPDNWTNYYDTTSVPVPAGYRKLHMIVGASCGSTFEDPGGTVSVQPIIRWNGNNSVIEAGPAIASPSAIITVANSFWSYSTGEAIGEGTEWEWFEVGLRVTRSGTPTAGSGNWHVSASIIFLT